MTICYALFECLLHVLYDSTLIFFLFLSSLFSFFISFLTLFIKVHKICILLSLFPYNFFFIPFFFTKFFLCLLLHLSDLSITAYFFFNSINLSFTWALSIQFSSYFVINNVILFDFVLTFKTRTIVPNFRTFSIYICNNLTIAVIFTHNILTFVFMWSVRVQTVCNFIEIIRLKT